MSGMPVDLLVVRRGLSREERKWKREPRKQVIILTCDCTGEQMICEYADHLRETQAEGGAG